jgi:hypothetical protein
VTVATPAEVRLADLVHAMASAIPSGPTLRHPAHGDDDKVYVSAIWDAILADRGSLLWYAFACPADWGVHGDARLDRDDGGYGLKAWLCHAATLRDGRGAPLVLLADGTGDDRLDPTATRRSRFATAITPSSTAGGTIRRDGAGAVFHFLVDRALAPDAYLPARRSPARGRAVFAPPAITMARAASKGDE